jgi:hypothetical protein
MEYGRKFETMHSLEKRIRKIEGSDKADRIHVVLWADGQTFESALRRSPCPVDATSRTLIHLQGVGGAPGSPVVDKLNDPEYAAEYAKAQAWAKPKIGEFRD